MGSLADYQGYVNAAMIALITLFIALNGVLFEVKRNPDQKPGINNLSPTGIVLIFCVSTLGLFTAVKQIQDDTEAKAKYQTLRATLISTENQLRAANAKIDEEKIKTSDIRRISEDTANITYDNQNILSIVNGTTTNTLKSQAGVVEMLRELQISQANNASIIESIRLNSEPIEPNVMYAKVVFKTLTVGNNCDRTEGKKGKFYYELYANGKAINNPPYTLESPLEISDNSKEADLGVIDGIRILGQDDSILVSGYVRERDKKNLLGRWTYKYPGLFSQSILVSEKTKDIQVLDEKDCDVKLTVNIIPYEI